eukprot:CAMPEP_0184326222 /NCGR_PEP_ID=MMETSP1049-20130417/142449_1 /TAXON_ID=77928 /ORGANISM="Proteomonas sulcata, Strain CCMP704" /LENGTH=202 /DNA_ID=CAMNT_0026648403 /DNA_START=135 /DNA_END=744 /DNA_ORIENTATION=-
MSDLEVSHPSMQIQFRSCDPALGSPSLNPGGQMVLGHANNPGWRMFVLARLKLNTSFFPQALIPFAVKEPTGGGSAPVVPLKSIIPVVMAGVIGIYGFIIAVVVGTKIKEPTGGGSAPVVPQYTLFSAFGHLGSGLTGGLSGLAAGMAIGIVGDAGVRATAQQPKLFVGMILILIFAEALGLYGLIVALIMSSAGGGACPEA